MDFEILVKSFQRFDKLLRLVARARRRYPGATLRIADDSPDSPERDAACRQLESMGDCVVYRLPANAGISVGRNHLVREVRAAYFLLTDDDKVFTRRTRVERLQAVLEADPDCVIAAGMNMDYGFLLRYQHGRVERRGTQVLRQLYGDRAPTATVGGIECVPCNLTPNFFLGSTALFRRHRITWDERFKVGHGEHAWFFANLPPQLHVYVVPSVRVSHFPTRLGDPTYRQFRHDPVELEKLERVEGVQVETARVYESRMYVVRRRLERLMRLTIDRITGRPA